MAKDDNCLFFRGFDACLAGDLVSCRQHRVGREHCGFLSRPIRKIAVAIFQGGKLIFSGGQDLEERPGTRKQKEIGDLLGGDAVDHDDDRVAFCTADSCVAFQHGLLSNLFDVFPQRAKTASPASRATAITRQMATLLATNDDLSRPGDFLAKLFSNSAHILSPPSSR